MHAAQQGRKRLWPTPHRSHCPGCARPAGQQGLFTILHISCCRSIRPIHYPGCALPADAGQQSGGCHRLAPHRRRLGRLHRVAGAAAGRGRFHRKGGQGCCCFPACGWDGRYTKNGTGAAAGLWTRLSTRWAGRLASERYVGLHVAQCRCRPYICVLGYQTCPQVKQGYFQGLCRWRTGLTLCCADSCLLSYPTLTLLSGQGGLLPGPGGCGAGAGGGAGGAHLCQQARGRRRRAHPQAVRPMKGASERVIGCC